MHSAFKNFITVAIFYLFLYILKIYKVPIQEFYLEALPASS